MRDTNYGFAILRVRSELRMRRTDCIENRSDITNARIDSALEALRIP